VRLASADGLNWSAPASGFSDALRGIVWNGNRFVAVGDYGAVYQSGGFNTTVPTISKVARADGALAFHFSAEPGRVYRVQSSTDLLEWSDASEDLNAGAGSLAFADNPMTAATRKFYRVMLP
jgi:hypothetical protein